MVTIKEINVASAFRVGAIISGLLWAVFGILLVLLQASLVASVPQSSQFGTFSDSELQSMTLSVLCFTYLCGVPLYAVIGGIFAAFSAIFYNFVAKQFGGLEVKLERKVMVTGRTLGGDGSLYGERDLGSPSRLGDNLSAKRKRDNEDEDEDPFRNIP